MGSLMGSLHDVHQLGSYIFYYDTTYITHSIWLLERHATVGYSSRIYEFSTSIETGYRHVVELPVKNYVASLMLLQRSLV